MNNSFSAAADKEKANRSLQWHILGGNNQHHIGANCGLCVYQETDSLGRKSQRALLFDAGVLQGNPKYPEHAALAECDTVIPDPEKFLRKKADAAHIPDIALDAIFLTHNHSDHIAAIPFWILMGYELPRIYATPYTAKRLEQELSNMGLPPSEWPDIYTIAAGKPVQEGAVKVTAFWVSHSTPQSVGFFIETPKGNILNTGDFKLDKSVVWGPAFSEEQFRRVVSKPVDLLLLDSTGADRDMPPITEGDVRETLRETIEKYPKKRFVIAVMSGFEENLASVAVVAAEYNRTLWVSGWSHEQSLSALQQTGMSLSDHVGQKVDTRVLMAGKPAKTLASSSPDQSIVVMTGASGKPNAALTRAADGKLNTLTLDPATDVILFCAPSIPGQEASRERLLATLRHKGFTVLTRKEAPLYSHAHARLPELIEMVKMTNPAHVLPIHGDARLREHCAVAMEKMGIKTVRADNGDCLQVSKKAVRSVSPASKGNPPFVGFKTLQGTTWSDRHYMMTKTSTPPVPVNNNRKRPNIFNAPPQS
jgi:ribonuclease J